MADPDGGDWMLDDSSATTNDVTVSSDTAAPAADAGASAGVTIPTGPPVPNPYAHLMKVPCKEREYQHWARSKHLQYKYLNDYSTVYYDDCINYMDKRRMGVERDQPHPQEWGERVLRVYAKEGERLTANDYKYWYTTANNVKPRHNVVHAVHSKEYFNRQYKNICVSSL